MKKLLYVFLAMTVAFAMVACGGGNDPTPETWTVSYDANGWTGAGVPAATSVEKGAQIGAAKLPALTDTTTQHFVGWALTGNGNGTGGTQVTATQTVTDDITLYVLWTVIGPSQDFEYVSLENGTNAVFKFTIPAGRHLEDYEKISAEYQLVYPENAAGGASEPGAIQLRSFRLYGNYEATDFITTDGGVDLNAYIAKFDAKNGAYIAENVSGAGWSWDYSNIPGFDPNNPGAWFTSTLPLTSTYSNNGVVGEHWPNPATFEGTLYLGIGITGVAGNPVVQRIKNVKLIGYSGVPDLETDGGVFDLGEGELPAFAGYAPYPKEASAYRGSDIPLIVKFNWNDKGAKKPASTVVVPGSTFGDLIDDLDAVELSIEDDTSGWLFAGWSTDADGTDVVDGDYVFALANASYGAITLYAQWEEDTSIGSAVPATADYTVPLAGLTVKNATAFTGQYNNGPSIPIAFPMQGSDQLDVGSYAKVTIKAKFYDADGTTEISGTNIGSIVWTKSATDWYGQRCSESYGLNEAYATSGGPATGYYGTINAPIHQNVLDARLEFAAIVFQNRTTDVKFIEITEITFHKAD